MNMDWHTLLNPGQLGKTDCPASAVDGRLGRSVFSADHDKIIFSDAFRRLARKTQVHPLASNDHIHTRLTHSLEVARVGRSLGYMIGLSLQEHAKLPSGTQPHDISEIVQCASLAHDIGNPPFGHTGEEAIRSWFSGEGVAYLEQMTEEEADDLVHFEGNAQGFRTLTTVENHLYRGGMRLSYATLAAFIKYPWTALPAHRGQRPKNNKFGVFCTELDIFNEVADAVGLLPKGDTNWFCRHPLAHVMEAADDFCYGILDLEDALEMGIITCEEVYEVLQTALPSTCLDSLDSELKHVPESRKTGVIRGKVFDAYVQSAAEAFLANEARYLAGDDTPLIDLCDDAIRDSVASAKALAQAKIYSHPKKVSLEVGAYNVMATLLSVMCDAAYEWVNERSNVSSRNGRVLDLVGIDTFDPRINDIDSALSPHYLAMRRVVDFISGMTDNYATDLAKRFSGIGV